MRRRVGPWIASLAAHVAVFAVWRGTRISVRGPEVTEDREPTVIELIELEPAPASIVAPAGGVPLPARETTAGPPTVTPRRRVGRTHPKAPPAPPIVHPPAPDDDPQVVAREEEEEQEQEATRPPAAPAGDQLPPAPGPVPEPPREAPIAPTERPAAGPTIKPRSPRLISASAVSFDTVADAVDHMFVAVLTIDTDGRVIGVKFKRGPLGPRTEQALSAAWHFQYHPAVDGDGHPIVSRVEQRFVLE